MQNFITTISPWVVPIEALEPFRTHGPKQDDPTPLQYLRDESKAGYEHSYCTFSATAYNNHFSYDIHLEVHLKSAKMTAPQVISRSNFKYMYWSMKQQLVHHAVTGCNLRPGDLLGSGTISGSVMLLAQSIVYLNMNQYVVIVQTPDSYGSLLEITWRGANPLKLESGEERKFLADGDSLRLKGFCQGDGYRIGFGDCEGTVLPHN